MKKEILEITNIIDELMLFEKMEKLLPKMNSNLEKVACDPFEIQVKIKGKVDQKKLSEMGAKLKHSSFYV